MAPPAPHGIPLKVAPRKATPALCTPPNALQKLDPENSIPMTLQPKRCSSQAAPQPLRPVSRHGPFTTDACLHLTCIRPGKLRLAPGSQVHL